MKRIIATLSFVAVSVLLLAGCASVSGSSGTNPVDLTKPSVIASLCGADAAAVQATVAQAADAKPSSGQRHSLVNWGIKDPTDNKAVASILSTLKERAAVKDCKLGTKPAASTKMTDAQRDAIIKALTVDTVSKSAVCKTDEYGNVAYQIDSLLGVPPRLWPDALSTPISATDPTAARVELQTAICKDPNLGSAWLTFMATTLRDKLLAVTGIDLVKLNPELKAYTDQSAITTKATTFVPLLNVKTPTTAQVDNAVKQNAAWQQDAAVVNTLLERFAALGIDSRQSIVNYHLTDYALSVHALPTVGVNDKQENLPALIFAITEKGQCGEITTFGANTGDKRPELFEAKGCTPPTTPGTTPGKTPPGGSTTTCTVPTQCLTPKNPKDDVTPPQGTTPLGPDNLQPTAPGPKPNPLNPLTPITEDPGPSVPVQGASPSTPSAPAPGAPQAPSPQQPGTPITDPDN